MMEPFDEMNAKLFELAGEVDWSTVHESQFEAVTREHEDRLCELISVIAEAVEKHYLDLLLSVGSKGTKTGKLDALQLLCSCLYVCNDHHVPPPEPLVDALETCTGVTERQQRDWEAQRKHYEPIIALFDYRQTNPTASQNQAANYTGLPRATVHRIENSAEWEKFVDAPEELERIRLRFRKNRGLLQTVYVAPTINRPDNFDEVRKAYGRLLKSRIVD